MFNDFLWFYANKFDIYVKYDLHEMKQSQTIKESSSANFPLNLFLFSVLLFSLISSNNKSIAMSLYDMI